VPVCSPISCSSESHSSNASCASLFLLFLKQQHYLSFTLGETAYIIIIIIIIHHEVGTNRRVLLSFKRHFTDLANRLRPFGQQFIFGILLLINLFTCGSQFDLYLYNCWSTGSILSLAKSLHSVFAQQLRVSLRASAISHLD